MNIGDRIVVTESVLVYDGHGHDVLIAGTRGNITGISDDLLTVQTAKGVYESIPISCVGQRTEESAA